MKQPGLVKGQHTPGSEWARECPLNPERVAKTGGPRRCDLGQQAPEYRLPGRVAKPDDRGQG
jgi:hypothetical protein